MKTVIEILNDIENEWNKRETGTDFLEGCRNGGIYALREAKERIQKETGWISVAVRLPETYHQMMFIDYHKNIYIGFFVGNGNWESNHIIIPDNITHWMPLPLPPNE